MSDLISRQAAITAIQKAYADTEGGTDKCAVWKNVGLTNALHIMQDLPSAQLEIIHCRDCKRWFAGSNNGIDYDKYGAECVVMKRRMRANDFCSYAERTEE